MAQQNRPEKLDHMLSHPQDLYDGASQEFATFEKLSNMLDTQFKIPGVPFRIGIDGLAGLVPIVGDGVTAIMGLYALRLASKHNLPLRAKLKMVWHIAVDGLVGAIPLVGDLFDFAYHSHRKNYHILRQHIADNSADMKITRSHEHQY